MISPLVFINVLLVNKMNNRKWFPKFAIIYTTLQIIENDKKPKHSTIEKICEKLLYEILFKLTLFIEVS